MAGVAIKPGITAGITGGGALPVPGITIMQWHHCNVSPFLLYV
jgi:hypothetical protein